MRVDPELGTVRPARFVNAFGAGRILNERTARSEYLGGRIMNANLGEYFVPVNADVPVIESIVIAEDDPHVNEIGVKGIGEMGIVSAAAALQRGLPCDRQAGGRLTQHTGETPEVGAFPSGKPCSVWEKGTSRSTC